MPVRRSQPSRGPLLADWRALSLRFVDGHTVEVRISGKLHGRLTVRDLGLEGPEGQILELGLQLGVAPRPGLRIRPYRTDDRGAIRQICADTAWLGGPGGMFLKVAQRDHIDLANFRGPPEMYYYAMLALAILSLAVVYSASARDGGVASRVVTRQ